ncbi:TRAP transporter substrate-binding protein [Hydrogenophaga sp.]|uniref:TRAP transporter substrate-binding protein n=1 Tax=Hydrogenophaga sp. TaxID=1904254 RepID=UPI00272FA0D6|nr:TRAP transporter substrate-binding protein [Hydrogenophaga sp.]MDP2017836.1 TRAP transporter substrate-binding protein [Hydrogenophaga sp.]MDP3166740.1 TRAP transporter substrate-binding protein [Hydrogenophaga sp.]MDP3809490.1 TRAP transporter substrate-binding protein [Hydrogenophaga sp.]
MNMQWAVVVLAGVLAQPCLAQQVARWQLATGYRVDSFHTQNIVQFAGDVEQATAGALRIEVRPNNTLFKLAEIRQAVQEGKVEAGEAIMTSMVGEIPIAGADAIPFVVHSYSDARRLWNLQRPLIEKHFAARGLKPLYVVPWPPQGLFTSQPVNSGADFRGTRMRTYNQSTVRIAEMLGASPVDVPMVEVNQALASRKVDSMITSAVTGVENRVWDQIGFYYGINAWFPKNIVFVNVKAFDALPAPSQEAVNQAAARAEARGWAQSEAVANESTQELQRRGIKVGRVPVSFEAELKRLGEKFSREWVKSVGTEANLIFVPYYLQR